MLRQPNEKSQPKRQRKIRFPKIVFYAEQLGVTRSHLYRVLTGERESPGLIKRFRDVILGIPLIDHIIIGRATAKRRGDFASLRELGYFYDSEPASTPSRGAPRRRKKMGSPEAGGAR